MSAEDRDINRRAVICQTFPGYTFEDLDNVPIRPLLRATRLLNIAQKAYSER